MPKTAETVEAPGLTGQVSVLKIATVISTAILVATALWALRRILEPFVLAVFLLIMVDGMARALQTRVPAFPKWAALPCAIIAIVAVFAFTIWIAINNAGDFAAEAPTYTARINALLGQAAQAMGLTVTPTLSSLLAELNPSRFVGLLARGLSHFAEAAVLVLIYLGFLVASRQGFANKTRELFTTDGEMAEARKVFDRVRRGVENYIWVQTVVGVMITAASAALMAATGLSHIAFWCLIIFLANYIPAIGAAVGVLFPAVFGLAEFDGLVRSVILVVGLETVHFVVSHVVQPRLQGRSLNLDPIVILLALAFWGVIWGVVGALLSTPLTVMAMAIFAEFRGTRPLAVLLSSDGRPYAALEGQDQKRAKRPDKASAGPKPRPAPGDRQ
jgi:AI-2 transport protein TqsA